MLDLEFISTFSIFAKAAEVNIMPHRAEEALTMTHVAEEAFTILLFTQWILHKNGTYIQAFGSPFGSVHSNVLTNITNS